jgi:hypothetical protein
MTLKYKKLYRKTNNHIVIDVECSYDVDINHVKIYTYWYKTSGCVLGCENNKDCPTWLGNKAEIVLMSMFKKVEKMPTMNPGFDFLCGKGYKIDAKSACLTKNRANSWIFRIRYNKIADFFLCLAFDNRKDLNPLHIWLIPRDKVSHLSCLQISETTLSKWIDYEKPCDKVLSCCDTLKTNHNI